MSDATSGQADSVKYGGVALTLVGHYTGVGGWVEIWRLLAPTVSTASIVGYFPGTQQTVGGAVSFNGVSQTAPTGTFIGASGTSTAKCGSVASAAGALLDARWGSDGRSASTEADSPPLWTDATGRENRAIRCACYTKQHADSDPIVSMVTR